MRKALFRSLVLALSLVLIAGASEKSKITTTSSDDSSYEAMNVYKGQGYYIINPSPNEPDSRTDKGIVLDIPVNDDCANAIEIEEVENLTADVDGATIDGGNFSTFSNIWYKYTATESRRIKVSTDEAGTDIESMALGGYVTVYDGSTCPESIDLPDPISLQGGETIETAVPVSNSLPVTYAGSFDDYNRDYTECSCVWETSANETGPDVVYSYTAASDDTITFLLKSDNTYLALVITDEDGNELACSYWINYIQDDYLGTGIFNFPVIEGEAYHLILSCRYEELAGDYILSIYKPDYNMIGKSPLTSNYYTDLVFDAVAGHEYLIELGYKYPSSTTVLSLSPAPDPPENDSCENATDGGVLEAGMTIEYTGDNTGATMICPLISELPEVWVKFTLEDTMNVRMDFCNNPAMNDYIVISSIISSNCPWDSHNWIQGMDVGGARCPNQTFLLQWYAMPPGTYYYPMLVHHEFEGEYVITIKGLKNEECDDESLFGQNPVPISDYSTNLQFYYSDVEEGYAVMDKFSGTGDGIGEITWWGISVDGEYISCDPSDPYQFQIIFLDINQTSPYIPGDTVSIYDVVVVPEETGYILDEYSDYEYPQYKFVANLEESIALEEGWIMIRGNDGINNCSFAWQNSATGDDGVIYDILEDSWTRLECGLGFCLGEGQVGIDDDINTNIPLSYELLQNYPNPFNATTLIQFSLKQADNVSLDVYDVGGRLIKTLRNGELNAGYHTVIWDGTNQSGETVSSGIYFYRLKTSEQVLNNRMVLLK